MANLKQDRNGVRTPADVERRHKLGLIEKTAQEVEEIKGIDDSLSSTSTKAVQNRVITSAINNLNNNKVSKATGMGLSHNDFTNEYKNKLESIKRIILFDNNTGSTNVAFYENIAENISYIDVFFECDYLYDSIRVYKPYNKNYDTVVGIISNSGITVNSGYTIYFVAGFEEVFE